MFIIKLQWRFALKIRIFFPRFLGIFAIDVKIGFGRLKRDALGSLLLAEVRKGIV